MNLDLNPAVINLIQTMLGRVTSNWRAVFLNGDIGCMLVTFVLATESSEDREEIEDLAVEFESLQPDSDVSIAVVVGDVPIETFADAGRIVFVRKE